MNNIMDLWTKLKTAQKPVLLYGMGNGADKIIRVLNEYGITVSGVFASDGFVRNKSFHGYEIMSYSRAKSLFKDMIVLLCFGSSRPEVIENIRAIASEQELYAPDVPVYGETLFNSEYADAHKEQLDAVRKILADDCSVNTFNNIVDYKLSGKTDYLFSCEVSSDEPFKNILCLNDSEIYADLGAYRGDTVFEFVSRVNDYKKIVAVEPDIKTYKKLCSATSHLPEVFPYNACVTDSCGTCNFSMNGSRGSSASQLGLPVNSVTVDELFLKSGVTYIKMDIEGEEKPALFGAEKTILKYKPKMQISCYHRSEDIFSIPLQVLSIRNDYRVFLRHFQGLPAWDTCYYFV